MTHAPHPEIDAAALAGARAGGHASGHARGHAGAAGAAHDSGQQHPIGVYLKVWLYLFVLSTLSYLVDYFQVEGLIRWVLILVFMVLKAGLILAIFMHMAWERMALVYAILVPPLALGTLVFLMWIEADYTFWTRILFFAGGG